MNSNENANANPTSPLISRAESVTMVNEFLAARTSILNGDVTYLNAANDPVVYNSSTEVHFTLKEMQKFMSYLESLGSDYDNLGIRAYFAAKTGENGDLTSTVILVPTGVPAGSGDEGNPNIAEAYSLNHGNAGMPPHGSVLTNP